MGGEEEEEDEEEKDEEEKDEEEEEEEEEEVMVTKSVSRCEGGDQLEKREGGAIDADVEVDESLTVLRKLEYSFLS